MSTQVQFRRGTTTQHNAFTGAVGEITVNTTTDTAHVHDGSTASGFPLARADLNNVSDTDLNAALTGNTISALTVTTLTGTTATLGGITGSASGTLKVKSNSSHHAIALEENSGNEAYSLGVEADGSLIFANSGSEAVRFDDSSNVGIGTSSISARLHIVGGPQATSGALAFLRDSTAASDNTSFGGIHFSSSPGTDFSIGKANVNTTTTLSFRNGNSGAALMDLDSSGNLGIGASTVDHKLHLEQSDTTVCFTKTENTAGNLLVGVNSSGNSFVSAQTTGKPLILETQNTERMRLTDTGDLLFAQTSGSAADVGHIMQTNGVVFHTASERAVMFLRRNNTDGTILQFRKNGTSVGTISTNANSLLSDRNFKTNISYDFALGLDFVTSLKPVTYNYKVDDAGAPVMSGLIAQDVEESLSAAGVEKNSMTLLQHVPTDDEEQSDYEMDYLKLVPVLIKSIQEQQKIITALETRIKTLENN